MKSQPSTTGKYLSAGIPKRLVHLFVWTLLSCMSATLLQAQTAAKYFENKDYPLAVEAYKKEVLTNPEGYYNLAKAYFAVHKFEEAKAAMQAYLEKAPKADKTYAAWFIEMMDRSEHPVPVKPLPGTVNTDGSESVPRISADGRLMYFTAYDRPGGHGGEDIWIAEKQADGSWGNAKPFSDLCSDTHETLYSMSSDANLCILFGNYEGTFGNGDLFYSVKTVGGWSYPCNLGGTINTANYKEAQATISPDGRVIIYMTSNKLPGHAGEYDLYMSRLTDNGWTKPQNLGLTINTAKNEVRPAFAGDGKTLYFSSNGHPSLGGYDIFMTRRLDDSYTNWTTPVNLGRYINTLQDDEDVTVNTEGTMGYTVKYDEVGAPGKYDIFQFVMPDVARPEQNLTVYGKVLNEKDTAAAVNVRFTSLTTNKLVKSVPSDSLTGLYKTYLPFDKYLMEINMKGFLYHAEELDLSNPEDFIPKKTIKALLKDVAAEDDMLKQVMALNKRLSGNAYSLDSLLNGSSYDLKQVFERYDALLEGEQAMLDNYRQLMETSRYYWLAQGRRYVDLEKNLKVQRATAGATFKLDNIFFDLGKATLNAASMPALDNLFDILQKNDINIELGGHTDSIGSDEANQQLSQERVNSVRAYLIQKGINDARIVAMGYGETKPVADNATDEGRSKNRRVEVKIIEKPKREGVEQTLSEKEKELAEAEALKQKGLVLSGDDLRLYLQKASRIGGLPKTSPCSEDYVPKTNLQPVTTVQPVTTTTRKPWTGSSLSGEQFDRSDYDLKAFSVGLSNFAAMDLNNTATGVDVIMANRKKIDRRGVIPEHTFTYYLKSGNVKTGFGYQYQQFVSLKPLTKLPMGWTWGLELKGFSLLDNTGNTYNTGLFAIPVGLKGLINIKDFVVSPAITYHWALSSANAEKAAGLKSTYWEIGSGVRWKFLYGGAFVRSGATDYLGLRLGLTL